MEEECNETEACCQRLLFPLYVCDSMEEEYNETEACLPFLFILSFILILLSSMDKHTRWIAGVSNNMCDLMLYWVPLLAHVHWQFNF